MKLIQQAEKLDPRVQNRSKLDEQRKVQEKSKKNAARKKAVVRRFVCIVWKKKFNTKNDIGCE